MSVLSASQTNTLSRFNALTSSVHPAPVAEAAPIDGFDKSLHPALQGLASRGLLEDPKVLEQKKLATELLRHMNQLRTELVGLIEQSNRRACNFVLDAEAALQPTIVEESAITLLPKLLAPGAILPRRDKVPAAAECLRNYLQAYKVSEEAGRNLAQLDEGIYVAAQFYETKKYLTSGAEVFKAVDAAHTARQDAQVFTDRVVDAPSVPAADASGCGDGADEGLDILLNQLAQNILAKAERQGLKSSALNSRDCTADATKHQPPLEKSC